MLSGCGSKWEFWHISKFTIDQNALKDSADIRLLYCSYGPDIPVDFADQTGTITSTKDGRTEVFQITDYYVHYIVIDITSGDTLNILTPEAMEINENADNEVFYYTQDIDDFKKMMYNKDFPKKIKPGTNIKNNKFNIPKHDRVARDPSFDHVADNEYKTVIGFIHRR